MNNIKKVKMVVRATSGSEIWNCIKDSLKLSIELEVPVELIHNTNVYLCDYKESTEQIYKTSKKVVDTQLTLEDAV